MVFFTANVCEDVEALDYSYIPGGRYHHPGERHWDPAGAEVGISLPGRTPGVLLRSWHLSPLPRWLLRWEQGPSSEPGS